MGIGVLDLGVLNVERPTGVLGDLRSFFGDLKCSGEFPFCITFGDFPRSGLGDFHRSAGDFQRSAFGDLRSPFGVFHRSEEFTKVILGDLAISGEFFDGLLLILVIGLFLGLFVGVVLGDLTSAKRRDAVGRTDFQEIDFRVPLRR